MGVGGGGGESEEEGGVREVSKAKHEREVPRCSGARAEAIEVPDWLTSAVRNSTGGGSRQSWSHDIMGRGGAPSMAVNKEEGGGRVRLLVCSVQLQPHYHSTNAQLHNSCGVKAKCTI